MEQRHRRNAKETEKPEKKGKTRKECKKGKDDKCLGQTREERA
jgi:hypothetical protein